mgnify:CR=1 FL=1
MWWSIVWRTLLFFSVTGAISCFLVGFIVGFLETCIYVSREATISISIIIGGLACIPVSILIIKNFINKRFSDFRVALVSDIAKGGEEGDRWGTP